MFANILSLWQKWKWKFSVMLFPDSPKSTLCSRQFLNTFAVWVHSRVHFSQNLLSITSNKMQWQPCCTLIPGFFYQSLHFVNKNKFHDTRPRSSYLISCLFFTFLFYFLFFPLNSTSPRLKGDCFPPTPSSVSSNKIMIFLLFNSTFLLRSMDGLSSPELSPTGDRMSELSALVHKGEKRGFFLDKMPAPIQRQIEDENLQFLRNRAVYNQEYITFVRKLASCSLVSGLWSLEIDCWKIILITGPVLRVLMDPIANL